MSSKFKVVDLFAGPGGLAEGFASVRVDDMAVFEMALSVEMEPTAFRTLRLRSFFRQFETAPAEYYDYLAGRISMDEFKARYPAQWARAVSETMMLELGTPEARTAIDPVLDGLRGGSEPTILIGGPPCQAYSLVGRARNRGIADYEPSRDHRHFLYREYIRIIERLRPAAFVMENVKGILSSRVDQDPIFEKILTDLRAAGDSPESYELMPLTPKAAGHAGYVVRCEDFGIPQCRHRVIVVGIRKDLADQVRGGLRRTTLQLVEKQVTVRDLLEKMPQLRSGLSREPDGEAAWQEAAVEALKLAASACRGDGSELREVERLLRQAASELTTRRETLKRKGTLPSSVKHNRLGAWLSDPNLDQLPNHDTRAHRRDDLARYAFAAAFGQVFDRSPKAGEFPAALAPAHRNWKTGKFADRFRVQLWDRPATTITSHISKDGHYFIHPDLRQCRSLTVREAARLQTFPDNYFFEGERTQQFTQVGNAVPPLIARQIGEVLYAALAPALSSEGDKRTEREVLAVP